MALPQPIAGNQDFTSVVDMAAQLPTLNVAELTASRELTNTIRGTPDLVIEGDNVAVEALNGSLTLSSDTGAVGTQILMFDNAGNPAITIGNDGQFTEVTLCSALDSLGFFGAQVVPRASTAVVAATFTANGSGIVNDSATYTVSGSGNSYTVGQVVEALALYGLLT